MAVLLAVLDTTRVVSDVTGSNGVAEIANGNESPGERRFGSLMERRKIGSPTMATLVTSASEAPRLMMSKARVSSERVPTAPKSNEQ